jgi:hypothetical protein
VLIVAFGVLLAGCWSMVAYKAPVVPAEFQRGGAGGSAEADGYRARFQDFWCLCVKTRAADLEAACPILCSGTRAESSGCLDGATNAEEQIDRALEHGDSAKLARSLADLANSPVCKSRQDGRQLY